MRNLKLPRALLVASVVLAAFLFSQVALSANSIGPPAEFWFTMDYQIATRPAMEGAQIVGCAAEDCAESELLMQYGTCDGGDCLPAPLTLEAWDTWHTKFECAAGLCRFSSYWWDGGYLRLVVQFSDRTRISDRVGPLTWQYGMEKAWRVAVRESSLTLNEDPDFRAPSTNYSLFAIALELAEAVELLLAAVFLRFAIKADAAQTKNALKVVFLVNLITLPVVWYTFPSWGRFQTGTARQMGWFILGLAAVYALLLVGIYTSDGKKRRTRLILTILSLPVAFLATLAALYVTSYGNYDVVVQGLSPGLVVLFSEMFAVVVEAWLISRMARKSLTGRQAAAMSLLANAASFLVGLWIIGIR
jgi:hypothetical protein